MNGNNTRKIYEYSIPFRSLARKFIHFLDEYNFEYRMNNDNNVWQFKISLSEHELDFVESFLNGVDETTIPEMKGLIRI